MTADSMKEWVQEFAALVRNRSDKKSRLIQDVVHDMTHESYLMKHTTGDVLKELGGLQELYPDAIYNGDANNHVVEYLEDPPNFKFWYDYSISR